MRKKKSKIDSFLKEKKVKNSIENVLLQALTPSIHFHLLQTHKNIRSICHEDAIRRVG